ncbi:MAG: two-component sensor histidine kinase [Lutibacter sp.]|nr:MAG: two-component sensor histidine kinase [Lutibacter sp.]
MENNRTLSKHIIRKLSLSLLAIILLISAIYILLSLLFSYKFFEETTQKLNSNIANHLIEEKFKDAAPFLEDGSVNKPLFGEIMHDMMAVNRAIEVYLLDESGQILYSVVLDHSDKNENIKSVDIKPIKEFISKKGNGYFLGDNPRDSQQKNIFSAAHYKTDDGQQGYIYIILASKVFQNIEKSLFSSYFIKSGVIYITLTILIAFIIGWLSIRFLTRNLRDIIQQVNRFSEGDYKSRIKNPEKSDLSVLALTYNSMADTIEKNIEEIKSVDVLRRELIANVSHDLRTPLAIMQGYVETLQMKKGKLSEQQEDDYIHIINKSINQLTKLVSQLFEYSKFESKQVTPQKEPFAITDLIYDIQTKYDLFAKEKNIKLSTTIQKDTPIVFADISLVERVIQNLLENAIKFTPNNGSVNIITDYDNNNVIIKINDSGKGISLEEQKYIFERFRQTDSNQKKSGIGLGLAIVKKIIELHGSTINIISKPNEGSTFEFYLPNFKNI